MAASVYAETEASDELRRIERLNKLQEVSSTPSIAIRTVTPVY